MPTLQGKANITVAEGTQSGKVFRLKGKGIQGVRSSVPGDLYCHVHIETPVNLSDEQKDLLRQFDATIEKDLGKNSPQNKHWTDKVKDFFSNL